jgi:undecaprenyl-diphosphatase
MADFLYNIDVQAFFFINKTLANPFTDFFMPFITDINHWKIFYVIMFLYLMIAGGRKGRIVGISLLLLVTVSDQLSSNLVKHTVERIRPCNVLQGVHLLVGATQSFSFPSSHAVNNFAGAVFLSHFYPKFKISFYIGASLMALSRVFVGVHYPSDVLGGMIIGIVIGLFFVYVWDTINKKFKILRN